MKSPTELPRQVLAFGDGFGMFPQGGTILCALSGGVDSMALLTLLPALADGRGLRIHAAHYNHQLRGAESQRDAAFVQDWCRRQGVPLHLGQGDVAAQAARTGRGIEDTARQLRYVFLERTAQGLGEGSLIATAHNANDNAETVLLHLLRGSGLDGLTGIPPRRGRLCRPLLECPREVLEAYLAAQGIPHVEDSSNADVTYRRNLLRREVMPVLERLNPSFSRRLAANLRHLRADRDCLDGLGQALVQGGERTQEGIALSVQALREAPRPVAIRGVKAALAALGRWEHSAAHLEAVVELALGDKPSGQIDLPQGLRVRRQYGRLLFALGEAEAPPPMELPGPGQYHWGDWTLRITPATCPVEGEGWYLRDPVFPLTLRPRQTGDRLKLPRRGEKSLKKWYIDEKIPKAQRDSLPVLSDARGMLAAAGLGPHAPRLAAAGEAAVCLVLERKKIERKEQQR